MKNLKPIEETFIWRFMDRLLSIFLIVGSASMLILIVANVVMRYFFDSAIFGAEEILGFLIVWMYWIGGTYGSLEDSHISADMTNLLIKNEKIRHNYQVVVRFVTMVIVGVFCYWSLTNYAPKIISAGSTTPGLHIPYVVGKIVIPVALTLMFLYSIYWFIRTIHPYQKKTDDGNEEGIDA